MDEKKMSAGEALEYSRIALWSTRGVEVFAVLRGLAKKNAALRAEVERLKDENDLLRDALGEEARHRSRGEKAEADLARYRRYDKLIEAAEKAHSADIDLDIVRWCEKGKWVSPSTNAILRAALSCRESPESDIVSRGKDDILG